MQRSQSPLWRYILFQVPGWVLALIGAWWLDASQSVPAWVSISLPICWVVKDMVLYPFLRDAYGQHDSLPIERLIGSQGHAIETLSPSGYIRIGSELWRAEGNIQSIKKGAVVEVIGVKGMILRIRIAPDTTETETPQQRS